MRDLDKKRSTSRDWYQKNRTLSIARVAEWAKNNPDKVSAQNKKQRAKNLQKLLDYQLMYKYGLTREQWNELFSAQGYCCGNPGCLATEPGTKKGWHTDHDHVTGKVRAILCHGCNVALGKVKDSIEKLFGLIEYLELHSGR